MNDSLHRTLVARAEIDIAAPGEGQGFRCPRCGSDNLGVVDSRPVENGIRRRRKCEACGERFTSYEFSQQVMEGFLDLAKFDAMLQQLDPRDLRVLRFMIKAMMNGRT